MNFIDGSEGEQFVEVVTGLQYLSEVNSIGPSLLQLNDILPDFILLLVKFLPAQELQLSRRD